MVKRRPYKPPLMTRLPRGLREQPAWVFIGFMLFLVGLSYLFGFTESAIAQAIGQSGLRVWGGLLSVAGLALVAATIHARAALERLSLRAMSCAVLSYTGYLLTVTPFKRTGMTLFFALALVVSAEIRAWHLKMVIRRSEAMAQQFRGQP